jgi:hypothetical protein
MRVVTTKMYDAFKAKKNLTLANTKVRIINGETCIFLFGNLIVKTVNGDIYICNGGHNSVTTRDRLAPFTNKIRKTGDDLIINEKLNWDGKWLNITEYNE